MEKRLTVIWALQADILETSSTTGLSGKFRSQTYYNLITGLFDWVESDARVKRPISVATTPWIGRRGRSNARRRSEPTATE